MFQRSRVHFHLDTYDFQHHNLFRSLFRLHSVTFDVFTYAPTGHRNRIFALSIDNKIFNFIHYFLAYHPQNRFISI